MQIIRLVEPGIVDKMIAFDELPTHLLGGVEMLKPEDLKMPREWIAYGPQFVLYYKNINKDKMVWEEICSFVPRNVERDVRLLDDLTKMAVPCAQDSHTRVEISPEDVPVIKIGLAEEKIEAIEAETAAPEHAKNCGTMGRGGRYTDGCPKCDALQGKKLVRS